MSIIWREAIINTLKKRDGYNCKICGQPFIEIAPPEIDHIKALSIGGENTLKNLQMAHSICNRKKLRGSLIEIQKINNNNNIFDQFEKMKEEKIIILLRENGGNISRTCRESGLTRKKLCLFLKKHHIIVSKSTIK